MKIDKTASTEFAWLIRREIWEHKLVTWGPGILALLIIVSGLTSFLRLNHAGGVFDGPEDMQTLATLSQAMLDLIDGPGSIDAKTHRVSFSYAHPLFWAPFIVVGD